MASSYALPGAPLASSHHGHGYVHSHSHSHSPSRQPQHPANTPRTLRQEKSNSTLHAHGHSHSEPHREHIHSHPHERVLSQPYSLPTPPHSNGLAPGPFEKQQYESSPALSQMGPYEPHLSTVDVLPHAHDHHDHHDHYNHHDSSRMKLVESRSRFTKFILPLALKWPLLHTILAEKDSRRIFYFMTLNFCFMMVQAVYGYLTDSLGLLSDSIHMFFDCLALAVGLFASVASKWPPSERFPYGFGKIESLSGFGNGVFLMLISIEIMLEAAERLADGRETKRLAELFLVSGLGLAVNLIGMACFGHHGHAGHDHGHSHGQSHGHAHSHSHDEHHHDHTHNCDHDHNALKSEKPHAQTNHTHSHDNENMHGIFLHVLADTMGSAAVMVSTALIYFIGWSGWDPLASCIIAILIFLSSVPLIKSSARKLLLTVPDDVEYNLRETLSGVSDIRGVASYSVPRFWMGDNSIENESEQVLGVMHVNATRGSDLEDVRKRTRAFLTSHGMDVVVQVEQDGDTSCWCGSSSSRSSPSRFS